MWSVKVSYMTGTIFYTTSTISDMTSHGDANLCTQINTLFNNQFDIFLRISYVIRRLCTNGISAIIEIDVQCVSCWGEMCETDNGQITYLPSLLSGKIFSHRAGTGHCARRIPCES